MPIYSLSFETILVDFIGLIVIVLLVSVVAIAAFVPDHTTDAKSE